MFLLWDSVCLVVKYGWDAIHVEKRFRDAIHAHCFNLLNKTLNNRFFNY
jgi:hypothetical protein